MAWACVMPEELSVVPRGLVCLTNLDTRNQPVHRSIWELFEKERNNAPLRYRLVSVDEEYPRSKSKRPTYEWYVPKGILKTNWMHKHLYSVPSLVVIFFELDWNDPQFKEKQSELKAKIDIIRNNLEGYGTTISVVLLQSKTSFPTVDDVHSSERDQAANSLCTTFEITKRSLSVLPVLPQPDNLQAWIERLEQTFIESSQNYYNNEIRLVKKHRDTLNQITHQLLHIRHQFKLGFFSEMKQDNVSAVKSYKAAYSHLTENARIHDTNILEMKMIAGFLTYKICRIYFDMLQPVEAINHFRRHADIFKSKQGPADLAFEHKAWLSKQFQTLGDLFSRCSLAIQTQHPGFYYQEAAYQSMARKQIAQTTCVRLEQIDGDPNEFLKGTEFFGQRPWRQHHQSRTLTKIQKGIEVTDAQKEREAINVLRDSESRVNHSELIISLLVQAITHFKKHAANRMKLYLMYNLAEEYAASRDFEKALNYFNHVVQAYRSENWWPILQEIVPSALKCAYLSVQPQDWIRFSLELLNSNIQLPSANKEEIQKNLENFIINNLPPRFEPIEARWTSISNNEAFLIDGDSLIGLVECKANFPQESVSIESEIIVQIGLKSYFPSNIGFHRLSISFNPSDYDTEAVMEDVNQLQFSPGEYRILEFRVKPRAELLTRTIEIVSVSLNFGPAHSRRICFQWRLTSNLTPAVHPTKRRTKAKENVWQNFPIQRKANILTRSAEVRLTAEHQLPVLLGEFYPIRIRIENLENVEIKQATLTCTCSMSDENNSIGEDSFLSFSIENLPPETTKHFSSMILDSIPQNGQIEQDFYVRCKTDRTREITIRLVYQRTNLHCMKEINVSLNVVTAISIQHQIFGMNMENLNSLRVQEPFVLTIDTKCNPSIPINVVRTDLKLSQLVQSECAIESQIKEIDLRENETVTEAFALRTQPIGQASVQNFVLGEYFLFWRRSTHPQLPEHCSKFSIGHFNVEQDNVFVETTMPNYVSLQQPFQIHYKIHNRSSFVHEYKVSLEQINLIVAVAGNTGSSLLVPPHSSSEISFTLVPTICGFVQLPKFRLSFIRPSDQKIDESIENYLPSHIFVVPTTID